MLASIVAWLVSRWVIGGLWVGLLVGCEVGKLVDKLVGLLGRWLVGWFAWNRHHLAQRLR